MLSGLTEVYAETETISSIYSLSSKSITGQEQKLSAFKGQVALVVNVASLCGFTDQYRGLQQLYLKYKDKGFVVLGFPSNDFGEQEPGSDVEIKNFCTGRFGVTFPLFSKSHVIGADKNPIYKYLTLQGEAHEVEWNFEKFLVGRDGKFLQRFLSKVEPDSKELIKAIESAL
jgi:glutathione peroxidase